MKEIPMSAHQERALKKMEETGLPLVHRPGGYWTYEGCPKSGKPARSSMLSARSKAPIEPAWFVSPSTVEALLGRGWVARTDKTVDLCLDRLVLTEVGRALVVSRAEGRQQIAQALGARAAVLALALLCTLLACGSLGGPSVGPPRDDPGISCLPPYQPDLGTCLCRTAAGSCRCTPSDGGVCPGQDGGR